MRDDDMKRGIFFTGTPLVLLIAHTPHALVLETVSNFNQGGPPHSKNRGWTHEECSRKLIDRVAGLFAYFD